MNVLMFVNAAGAQQVSDEGAQNQRLGRIWAGKVGMGVYFPRWPLLSHFTKSLDNVWLSLLPLRGQGCGSGGGDAMGPLRLHYRRRYSFLLILLGHVSVETPCGKEAQATVEATALAEVPADSQHHL